MTNSDSSPELYAWLRLSLEPNLGPAAARMLLATFGLPHQIYDQSVGTLSRYISTQLAAQLHADPDPDLEQQIQQTLAWEQQTDQHILCLADPHYPAVLLNLHDPPLVLYAKGNLSQFHYQALAIVGARSSTNSGNENAYRFARFLASENWCIVSGLATGIDTAAHQGALAAQQPNSTIAVLGTGMDIVYPARNRDLAHQIAAKGLLISEFPLGARALPYHFVRRNRLVAALSRGVLVVEAALKSGSLTTARFATEIGREVFAIPGSIHSPLHKGCHQLIRSGAKLVESAEHILEEISHGMPLFSTHSATKNSATTTSVKKPTPIPDDLAPELQQLLNVMGYDAISPDQIQNRCDLSAAQIGVALVQLELLDLIMQELDGRYLRT